jgi:purine-binding chemotaxis protein CheW
MTLALVPGQAERYSTFTVGGEHYAIPAECVREVLSDVAVVHVPAAPRFMRGAIAVGSKPVAVVDLGSRLGQAFRSTAARTVVLVVSVQHEGQTALLGLTADSVGAPIHLSSRDVVAAPSFGAASNMDSFIAGMGRHGHGLVLLLDVDRILSASEMLAADEFAACAELPPDSAPGSRHLHSL